MIGTAENAEFAGHGKKPCNEAHSVSHERRAPGLRAKTKCDCPTFPDFYPDYPAASAYRRRAATAGRLLVCTACGCAASSAVAVGPQRRKNSPAGRPRKPRCRAANSANIHLQHGVTSSMGKAASVASPVVVWLQRQSTTRCFASGRRTVPPKLSQKANRPRRCNARAGHQCHQISYEIATSRGYRADVLRQVRRPPGRQNVAKAASAGRTIHRRGGRP